jgi:HD-like signal output (HDOD) protein
MHDVGKPVIAERTPVHFARSLAQAEQEGVPLFEVEEKLIHVSRAEVGAYLLSVWGLPYTVVEAVAHHHHPRRVPTKGVDMILAVYAANLLAREVCATKKNVAPPKFDMEFLQEGGAADLLPKWRGIAEAALAREHKLVN